MKSSELFKNALWISPDIENEAPYIRGEFEVKNVKNAKITICGLGFFELYLNGKKVSKDILVPAYTDYENRPNMKTNYPLNDKHNHRILAMQYDIAEYLLNGKNTIGIMLGNGWYNQNRHHDEGNVDYGTVKLCYLIEINDENGDVTFVSNENLLQSESYIIENNIYFGEVHDYSKYIENWAENNLDTSNWKKVNIIDPPSSNFYIQECEGDAVVEEIIPTLVKDFGEYSVYDMGVNTAGFPVVYATVDNCEVSVFCTEELNADKTLNPLSCDNIRQPQKEVYKNCINGVLMYPKFTWHGFRYFSLTNNAKPKSCAIVHINVDVSSSFECDNENLNWIYKAYVNTQLANIHAGIPSDCPHIERLGYTGDGQLCCETGMLLFDSKRFYRKWIDDIADSQDRNTGHVQHTAPYSGGGGGVGGWGCAIVEVPYSYYKMYGETEVLKIYLPNMVKYLNYCESRCEGNLIVSEEPGGWNLGDWCTLNDIALPEPFINTYFYIKSMLEVIEIAKVLGEISIIGELEKRIERSKHAITSCYFSTQSHDFIGNIQGANAFALDIGLGDSDTYKRLYNKYNSHPEYDTGIFGTDVLTRIFFEKGNYKTAYNLLVNENNGSFYNMKKLSGTTLLEYWTGERSHSHPMFGAVTRYLIYYLLGIRQRENSVGWNNILIKPAFINGLNNVKGHVTTPMGRVSVDYTLNENETKILITLENDMNADFVFETQKYKLKKGENLFTFQKIV